MKPRHAVLILLATASGSAAAADFRVLDFNDACADVASEEAPLG
jgi:hypothetical protein